MIQTTFWNQNIALLFIIAAAGVTLAVVSYQYSSFTAAEIAKIASQDVKSNARIQAYDLSRILFRSIDSITTNLQIITNSPAIQNNETESAQTLLTTAQDSTSTLTNAYYWLDKDGQVVTWSNRNDTINQIGGKLDLSYRQYFVIPKERHLPYHSSEVESSDNVPRLYVSLPILDNQKEGKSAADNNGQVETFKGVIVAAINVSTLGKFLQNEILPEFISNVGLMDKNGIILYARNQSLIGKDYLGKEFQSLIPSEIKEQYNAILGRSLQGKANAEQITFDGEMTTISYQPVLIEGKHLWTLFISSPHKLASNVGNMIEQQKNFSTLMVIIIGAIAVGIAFLILSWNRRLETAVNSRTAELKKVNLSLTESNKLLAEANEQLKVHDKMQKEFINIAAHELRTPIMPILGEAEFIEHQFNHKRKTVEIEKEQVSMIIRNAKRLDRLASDILDVAKIESQSLKLNKERFNLKEVLESAVQDLVDYIANNNNENNPSLRVLYKASDVIVEADKERITQVISNLLSNALKFTEEGYISVSAEKKGKDILVTVKDTGVGIDQEVLPRLFSKFITKSEKGTGLGLYISKNIVERHGGKIWAENNADGKGATFTFSIPISDCVSRT
ncbi:MAG TPA: sensor histidine kinase [Nitrososphaeraceae archaeon]|nr:sensor histidine kinase [Nitrososphaeraceae archaeon]